MRSQFVLTVVRYDRLTLNTLQPIWQAFFESFMLAYEEGFALCEYVGDWKWHGEAWCMKGMYYKCMDVCHQCLSVKRETPAFHGRRPWADFHLNDGIDLPRTLADFRRSSNNPLSALPGFHPTQIKFCSMHGLNLGLGGPLMEDRCALSAIWCVVV